MKLALLLLPVFACAAETGPVATVAGGQIRGRSTPDGGAAFKGVPYARPPLGELRWREPRPVAAWTGIREAAAFSAACSSSPKAGISETCRTAPKTACI